jgi:hypothetical protein
MLRNYLVGREKPTAAPPAAYKPPTGNWRDQSEPMAVRSHAKRGNTFPTAQWLRGMTGVSAAPVGYTIGGQDSGIGVRNSGNSWKLASFFYQFGARGYRPVPPESENWVRSRLQLMLRAGILED